MHRLPLIVLILPFRDATFVGSAVIRQRQGPVVSVCVLTPPGRSGPSFRWASRHPRLRLDSPPSLSARSLPDPGPPPFPPTANPPFPLVSISAPRFVGSFPTFEKTPRLRSKIDHDRSLRSLPTPYIYALSLLVQSFLFCHFPAVFTLCVT